MGVELVGVCCVQCTLQVARKDAIVAVGKRMRVQLGVNCVPLSVCL